MNSTCFYTMPQNAQLPGRSCIFFVHKIYPLKFKGQFRLPTSTIDYSMTTWSNLFARSAIFVYGRHYTTYWPSFLVRQSVWWFIFQPNLGNLLEMEGKRGRQPWLLMHFLLDLRARMNVLDGGSIPSSCGVAAWDVKRSLHLTRAAAIDVRNRA